MEKSLQNQQIYSVSDLIAVINQTLDYAYPSVTVIGEVSEYKVSQGKWVYFTLKDESAGLKCFMSIWQLRVAVENGMQIAVTASPSLTKWGFSLNIKSIRPVGAGAIQKSFELLKAKLDDEGLFATERKRTLPTIPSRVAVISSTQAAGYADFIKILNDRWGGVSINVAHTQVQGDVAPDQIIRAIEYFNQLEVLPEVIVIIRGGGSAEDLSAFNDEKLVRAIAASRIPTLVGVGHEIDTSLADLVADVSASTPSNAAQILVPDRAEIIRAVNYQVKSLLPRVESAIVSQIDVTNNYLTEILQRIDDKFDESTNNLLNLRRILAQLDPKIVLKRGYALVFGAQKVGEVITIETNKNIMKAEVKNVKIK